jgi:hypothetical protein
MGLSARHKVGKRAQSACWDFPDDAEVCAVDKMSLAEMRIKIKTPVGLLLVLAVGGKFLLDSFEEGRVILENLPPILHFLSRPISSLVLFLSGVGLILWELQDIRATSGEPTKRQLQHYVVNSVASFVGLLIIVVLVGGIYAIYARLERPPVTGGTAASLNAAKPRSTPSNPQENSGISDSIAVEVRRAKPSIEFAFQSNGDKKQKITSSAVPELIELEPKPTGIKESDLPIDVQVGAGTITVLRFGQQGNGGYMIFDTHDVPVGTSIRGRILGYEQPGSPPLRRSSVNQENHKPVNKPEVTRIPSVPAPEQRPTVISAPNGIAIGGGNVSNPTVNNYAPPQRHLGTAFIDDGSKCLSQIPGTVIISAPVGNAEAYTYAQDLYKLFGSAHWAIKGNTIHGFLESGRLTVGTEIFFRGTWDGSSASYDRSSAGGNLANCLLGTHIGNENTKLMPSPNIDANEVSVTVGSEPRQNN